MSQGSDYESKVSYNWVVKENRVFKDKVKVKFKAGNGGKGGVFFEFNQKPGGGFGGNGGNVYLKATTHEYDFARINNDSKYEATDGEPGGKSNSTGKNGEDIVLEVPLITHVYDENGELVASVEEQDKLYLIAKGGKGGLGNFYYKKTGISNRYNYTKGLPGATFEATLELELYSDVIFIGFPNAGKSSILREITNADAKVAPYAFTTLNPQIGRMNNLVLMDLPGLIEGTFEGKGLGTRFVRHTKKAKVLAHFISLESEDILETYTSMREELKNIDPELVEKKELIVLTKSDLVEQKDIEKKRKILMKVNKNIVVTSAYDLESLENLKEAISNML